MVGATVLLKNMSLDYNTVFYACKLAIPASFIAGLFGFMIGKIAESSRGKTNKQTYPKKNRDPDLLIDDLLVEELKKVESEIE